LGIIRLGCITELTVDRQTHREGCQKLVLHLKVAV
jgi:hypothetical protein